MSDDPSSTPAWARSDEGGRRLARRLNDELTDGVIVFHDRRAPRTRGTIDHLVVATSGVWVVKARSNVGRVETPDLGGWLADHLHIYVGGHDRSRIVDGVTWQAKGVHALLTSIDVHDVPVHAVLCFTNTDWGLFAGRSRVNGATITWPNRLIERIRQPGRLDVATLDLVARELGSRLSAPIADRA
jgi:hypothetical protein